MTKTTTHTNELVKQSILLYPKSAESKKKLCWSFNNCVIKVKLKIQNGGKTNFVFFSIFLKWRKSGIKTLIILSSIVLPNYNKGNGKGGGGGRQSKKYAVN